MSASGSEFRVRHLEEADIEAVVAIQRECFPPPFPESLLWSASHLHRHLEIFPVGQFVAASEKGHVAASASSLIVSEENWNSHRDWETTTGGHGFSAHDPCGSTLYGADISVHPAYRGLGLARALYQARFELVRQLGLARFGTACRLPDFVLWKEKQVGEPERYVAEVVAGRALDRTLTPLLRIGLRLAGIIENHMDDPESGHAAAILEWTP